jgi:hypothetical protein
MKPSNYNRKQVKIQNAILAVIAIVIFLIFMKGSL